MVSYNFLEALMNYFRLDRENDDWYIIWTKTEIHILTKSFCSTEALLQEPQE